MKLLLAILTSVLFIVRADAQVITYDDFRSIIPLLQKEDFKSAFEKTNSLLSKTENDSSDLRGIVTYMNIFSAAGMVSGQKMSYDDFIKNVNKFIGQRIVMSAHPCVDSSTLAFNSLKFVTKDGELQGTTTTTNNDKTSIFCFEYFTFASPVNPSDFIGKNVRCGGILQSIETNPNKSTIWISRLQIINAFARIMEK